MEIEGKTVTALNYHDPVTYIPPQANGDIGHRSCKLGVIINFNEDTVFVLYCDFRTIQATEPQFLVWG